MNFKKIYFGQEILIFEWFEVVQKTIFKTKKKIKNQTSLYA